MRFILTPPPRRLYNHATQLHLESFLLKPTDAVISRGNHRRTAFSVAVCYVLASTFSGAWHMHAGAGCAARSSEVNAEHGSHHEHAGQNAAAGEGCDHGSCPAGDDECVVCRFVAQNAISTPPVAEPGPCVVVAEVRPLLPSAPPKAILSCGLARAPPAAG